MGPDLRLHDASSKGPLSFYAVRFLLGIAEAGFFPGMILYLSYWFPARERARAVGVFMSAIAISYAIGAPISGGIMSVFDGVAGLEDWQWLFIIEAIPAVVAGVLVFWKLPDGPQDAGWLEPEEKAWLAERLEGEEQQRLARERHSLGEVLKDRRVLVFALLYFTMVINVYGLSFWVGEIVDQINGIGDVGQGLRDRDPVHRRDRRHGRDPALLRPHRRAQARSSRPASPLAAVAFVVSTLVGPVAAIAALAVGLFFLLGVHGVFWTMPAALLSGAAAAAGHRADQLDRQPRRLRRPVPRRPGQGRDRLDRRRPDRARRDPARRQRHRPARRARQGARAARPRRAPAASTARASPSARRTEFDARAPGPDPAREHERDAPTRASSSRA